MKKKYLIPAVLCFFLCLVCIFFLVKPAFLSRRAEPEPQVQQRFPQNPVQTVEKAPPEAVEVAAPYVSPVDFETLFGQNPDIYAWLDIPNTDVSYPVVQSTDDTFYLDRDIDGEKSAYGAIFSESTYNGKDFSDPITVLYGHNMIDGSMFGSLQILYSDRESIGEHSEIIVYMPEQELHYKIFSVVPYDNRHIPYNYGDGTARGMKSFLESVSAVKSIDAYWDAENSATLEDKLLVLSTCLNGNRSGRFIVVAKQINSI